MFASNEASDWTSAQTLPAVGLLGPRVEKNPEIQGGTKQTDLLEDA